MALRKTTRSKSIPISPPTMGRTKKALSQEEAHQADIRDYRFFCRIVDRILSQQKVSQRVDLKMENNLCLASIIRTRHDWDRPFPSQAVGLPRNLESPIPLTDNPNSSLADEEGIFVLDL